MTTVQRQPIYGSRERTILFTEGLSTSARQALYALGPKYTIDVLSPVTLGQCRFSRFVRRWIHCKPFGNNPEGYLCDLLWQLRAGRYQVLFPTHEQVYLLAKFQHYFAQRVGLVVPPFEAVDHLLSKVNFIRLLDTLGISYPATEIVSTKQELLQKVSLPCWLKVDYGTAGEGVRFVASEAELKEAVTYFENQGWLDGKTRILVQEPARGTKGAVSGLFQHGRLIAHHCDRALALGVGGSTLVRESVDDPGAVEDIRKLGEHLSWHGPMAIEIFRDPTSGKRQYLECNPRIGETLNPTLAGVNFCELMVRMSLGETLRLQPAPKSGVRTHQGFLALLAVALNGGKRWDVAKTLLAWLEHRQPFRRAQDELTRPRDDLLSTLPAVWTSLQLLLCPQLARRIVTKTVKNYALDKKTVEIIRSWPEDYCERLERRLL